MPAHKNCTLIISSYNWPESLRQCLKSVAWQTILPREVIVADDGSRPETAELVESIRKTFPVTLHFITQEDIGKRKTRICNIAIEYATYPYLIFIDQDMILHPEFIHDHLLLVEQGYFLNGSRFLVDEASTKWFLETADPLPTDLDRLKGKNSMNKRRIPFLMDMLAHRYRTGPDKIMEVRGCNMSFWKEDLVAVNGYDETYIGWGREDSDIAVRLYNNGVGKKSIKFGAIGYHMHHNYQSRASDPRNLEMVEEAARTKKIRATLGLDQHVN